MPAGRATYGSTIAYFNGHLGENMVCLQPTPSLCHIIGVIDRSKNINMEFNKSDLPYFYETDAEWGVLSNGVQRKITWEYTLIEEASYEILGETYPIIFERIRRKQHYRFDEYHVVANSVDEWQYLEKADEPYAGIIKGYRGYWDGVVELRGKPTLQPEIAVMLGLSPDLDHIPTFIETVSLDELLMLMEEAQQLDANDDLFAFHRPVPIATPPDAPEIMVDTIRRVRAQAQLHVTKGRAALLERFMTITGTQVVNGGWTLTPEEQARRTGNSA